MSNIRKYTLNEFGGHNVMVESYDSAMSVAEDCKTRQITDYRFNDMNDGTLGHHRAEWCGVKSYDEAIDFLKDGYQPIVDDLKLRIKSNAQGDGKRITFHNDIVGYAPIVPLAIQGVPNAMMNMTMRPIKTKVIDLYCDGAFSGSVDSGKIIKLGSKIISVSLQLEQQGYRFNLYETHTFSDNYDTYMLKVKIKDASQPIDLKRISFPLCHTAFHRVISFDWYSKCKYARYISGYGCPLTEIDRIKGKIREFGKALFGDNAVFIVGSELLKMNVDALKEHLTKEFTQCNTKQK